MTQPVDKSAILKSDLIELRGPSGKLYGMLDRRSMIIEFKAQRGGCGPHDKEMIDLKPYLEATKP